jgi:H+/gluconate symporter-like permease
MFREANLPRALIMAPMGAGGASITMTTLPGTPSLTNIIPSQWLGTPLTAAPVFSLILALIITALSLVYFRYAEKEARRKNEQFSFPPGFDASLANAAKSELPHPAKAFMPIILLPLFIIISSVAGAPFAVDPIQLTTFAMIAGSVLCLVLNPKKVTATGIKNWVGDGANNGIVAIASLAAVLAFGAVVSGAPAFQNVLQWVMGLELSVYFKGLVSTAIVSGIVGSSSGGVQIALANLGPYFIQSGANLEVLHRIVAMGAGTLDTLPHVSAIFVFLAVLGCTHKEAYRYLFWSTVIIPSIVTIFAVIAATIIW